MASSSPGRRALRKAVLGNGVSAGQGRPQNGFRSSQISESGRKSKIADSGHRNLGNSHAEGAKPTQGVSKRVSSGRSRSAGLASGTGGERRQLPEGFGRESGYFRHSSVNASGTNRLGFDRSHEKRGDAHRRIPGDRPSSPRRGGAERAPEPALPAGVDIGRLDRSVRTELRSLAKPNAEVVAGHLIMAGELLDSNPLRALEHARAARGRASRLAATREAVGVAAYHAGEWAEALNELRTARRISGDPRNLPLIADTERALGRPQNAVKVLSDPQVAKLDPETKAELFIVVAGARRDMGQTDAALATLARGGLDLDRPRPGSARLWYAYADILEAEGRLKEAATWFAHAAMQDVHDLTDAVDRAANLL